MKNKVIQIFVCVIIILLTPLIAGPEIKKETPKKKLPGTEAPKKKAPKKKLPGNEDEKKEKKPEKMN